MQAAAAAAAAAAAEPEDAGWVGLRVGGRRCVERVVGMLSEPKV